MKSKFFKTSFNWKETLEALIEINYLAIIFLVPLFFSYLFPTYNIFELNKLFLFKTLTWLLLLFSGFKLIFYSGNFLIAKFDRKKILKLFKGYLLIPIVFIVGLAITLFFSVDISQSFYGSYDRQEGFLSYLFYFIWFVLLLVNIKSSDKKKTDRKIKNIIIVSVISGFIVALYGVLQFLNIDFVIWEVSSFLDLRITSTLGQPNFLASYLLLVIPLSFYLLIKSPKFLGRFFYLLILIIQIFCLFITASRGALLSLVFVSLAVFLFLWFKIRINLLKKIVIICGFLSLVFLGLFSLEYISPGRISNVFNLQYGSSAVRVIFYKVAVSAISERPVFAYGLENSSEVFIKYYKPDWGVYGDVGSTTDRAHNLLLDILLNGGFFALIIFSLLYYQLFYLAKRNIKKEGAYSISLFLASGAAAYLISLLFSFTIISGEVYFWLYLAILSVINLSNNLTLNQDYIKIEKEIDVPKKIKIKTIMILYYFIACFILMVIIYYGINSEKRTLMADYYFNKIYYTLAEKQYFDTLVLNSYLLAEKTNIVNQNYYDQFLASKLSEFYPGISELSSKYIIKNELERIDSILGFNGYKNVLAHADINGALGNINKSEEYFSTLEKFSPFWPILYSAKGQAQFLNKKYIQAINTYQTALSDLPKADDPRFKKDNDQHYKNVLFYYYFFNREIANSYFSLSDYNQAEIFYQKAYLYNISDFSLLKKIADTYYLRSNFLEAIRYNEYGYKKNPKDYHWPLAISILYHENNNQVKAIEYLNQAIKLAPDQDEVKNLQMQYSH